MENISKSKGLIEEAESVILKTYSRHSIVFERGEGVELFDVDGRAYLDFFSGIGVNALGYHDKRIDTALQEQMDKLWHISNIFYNEPAIRLGEKLLQITGMERVFFTNSGTEAIEGALKIAKKHGKLKGSQTGEIIAFTHSFHGRSLGALSVTGKEAYRFPFEPLIPNIRYATFNDIESLKAIINEDTAGIILEPIQGEGGVHVATEEFLREVRALADRYNAILIFDEIQCGMGRSGTYFAHQAYDVVPDVMTVAKALGNGVPIGAFLANKKAKDILVPGDHGSTYGGNPLVCAVANAVLDVFESDGIIAHVCEISLYLREKLEALAKSYAHIVQCRGKGLLLGLEFDIPVGTILKSTLEDERLILINAGTNVIRFIPPLIIEKKHVDDMIERLERVLKKI